MFWKINSFSSPAGFNLFSAQSTLIPRTMPCTILSSITITISSSVAFSSTKMDLKLPFHFLFLLLQVPCCSRTEQFFRYPSFFHYPLQHANMPPSSFPLSKPFSLTKSFSKRCPMAHLRCFPTMLRCNHYYLRQLAPYLQSPLPLTCSWTGHLC